MSEDRRIQYTVGATDTATPVLSKTSAAMAALNEEAEQLGQALDDAKATRGLVSELTAAERELAQAEQAAGRASRSIEKLRADLEQAPKSSHLVKSLRDAEQRLEAANQRIDAVRPVIADLGTALSLAGVDTNKLADEQKRLADEVEQAGRTLKANSDKIVQQKAVEARAAREAGEAEARALQEAAAAAQRLEDGERTAAKAKDELTRKTKAAAEQARELLQRQREGVQATAEHNTQIGVSIKRLAAYAAGLFGVGQVLGKLREGITAVFRSGNDNEQALAQLNAALASTGNAAGMTAEQLQALADQLSDSSLFSAEQIVSAETRLLSYTDVAAEQFPRAMQIVIDQAQRLGMSVEQSAETVGKALQSPAEAMAALGRQGFKLEAGQKDLLKQLVATGRTAEAQAVIMDMLAEAYGGSAAAAQLNTATGLWKRLTDQIDAFAKRVSKSGAYDYLKQKLKELSDYLQALADDGTLERWAKQASDAIVGFARSLENAGRWVANHATAIKALAAAYAAFKLASLVTAMARWATSVQAAAMQTAVLTAETNALAAAQSRLSVAQVLSGGLAKLGGVVEVAAKAFQFLAVRLAGWAGVAVLAADYGKPLGEMFAKMSPAVREAEASIARLNEQMREQHRAALLAADGLKGAADVQLKTAVQLRHSSEQERAAYLQRLQALEEYRKAQMKAAIYGREVGAVTEKEFQSARDELVAVRRAMDDVSTAADFTASAFKGRLTAGALELVEQFTAMRRSGKEADEVLAQLGKNFDPSNADQLRDMGVLLQYLGQYGILSGEQIQQFLIGKLEKLSGKDLLRVQQVAKDVFDGMGRGAEALGMVVDASLGQALQHLGIDLEEVRTGFDKGTRETLEAFSEVIRVQQESGRSAQDSAKLIEAAYVAARQKINDPAALDQLDSAFKSAAKTAGMTATEISRGMTKARGEVDNTSGAIRDMGDALSRIGSASSTMELANIGVVASKAFHEGRMSAEQYAKVQEALKAKTLELEGAIRQTGAAGVEAGEQLTKSQQMYNRALEDGILTNEELRRISGQRMEEERKGIDAAMQARRKGVDDAKSDMGGFSDWLGGVMTAARAPLAAMSQAAVQLFEDLRGIKGADPGIDTSNLDATRRSFEGVAKALDEVVAASASPFLSRLGKWQLDTQRASLETQKAFLGQKAAMQGLMESYSRGDMSAQQFVRSAKGAKQAMGLLDDSDLSSLESAIRSAQQQMVQMERSTKSTLDSLKDELDALEGREADIERRKFASRRTDLQAQVAEAEASGNAQAVANAQRALGLLRQVEVASEQQRQRAEQEKRVAEVAAAAPATPAAVERPATVVRFESPRGGGAVDVQVGSAADETKLLDILADAGLRSL